MRVLTPDQILTELAIAELDADDKKEKEEILLTRPYSVIVEAFDMEMENLEKWIETNVRQESLSYIYYGKAGYNFWVVEYFFTEASDAARVAKAVPAIYTTYQYPRPHISRTDGYDKEIEYDPKDPDAIVFN